MSLKFLVTGGAGFIGSHIVEELLSKGYKIVIIDDLSSGSIENISKFRDRVEFVEGSIVDFGLVSEVVNGVDGIFHLAARPFVIETMQDPVGSTEVNFNGTLNVLEAARAANVRSFVFSSSSAVYGDSDILPIHEQLHYDPISPYAAAKLASEQYVTLYAKAFELPAISLRYMNIFGERQNPASLYSAVIPKFINLMLIGDKVPIYGDGEQTRDFLYVSNVVDANMLAFEKLSNNELQHGIFNIGSGKGTSINELVKILENEIDIKANVEYQPERPGEIKHSFSDISLAEKSLGFNVEIDFKKGIKNTLEYIQSTLI